jgi:poly(A) polymerase
MPASFDSLRTELQPLTDRFSAAGHRLFLVGGTVRDLLLAPGEEITMSADFDVDVTTTARPDEIKRCLQGWADAIWTQGERFGTIGAVKRVPGREPASMIDRVYEITTHRAEAYRFDSRKPDVEFSDDVHADLSRRDFTVNAMAVELTAGATVTSVVDPFGGQEDLAAHRLRTPVSPEQSFSDDPLRMLRAARFIAKYRLTPEADLVAAVRAMADRLSIVSAERVRDELHKLLASRLPGEGLRFCLDTGLMAYVVPELTPRSVDVVDAIGRDDGLLDASVLPGALAAIDRRLARLAALVLDSDDPRRRLQTLRHSNSDLDEVARIVASARRLLEGVPPATARRQVYEAGPVLAEAIEVARRFAADGRAGRAGVGAIREMADRINDVAVTEDLTDLGPELDGSSVMSLLGVPQGREVGAALEFLQAVRLDEGRLGHEAITSRLLEWWRDRR